MKVRGWHALAALTFAMILAGCSRADPSIIADSTGDSGNTPAGESAGPIEVAADAGGQLKYQEEALTGPADQAFAVSFSNPAPLQHNWVLVQPGTEDAVVAAAAGNAGNVPEGTEGTIAAGAILNQNGQEEIDVPATPAGNYTYLCTVPGHYASGMKGTMTLGAPAGGAPAGGDNAPAASGAAAPAPSGAAPAGDAGGLAVQADPANGLKFEETTLTAKAGAPFEVTFSNPAVLQHNWVLVEPGQEDAVVAAAAGTGGTVPPGTPGAIAAGALLNQNGSEAVPVPALQPGDYTYLCSVPGHYAAGMKGTLTVSP